MLACTPDTFNTFYNLITQLQNEFNIKTVDIHNMDEIGSHIGPETDDTVLGPSSKSSTITKGGSNRE